jgi:hypothetical protein
MRRSGGCGYNTRSPSRAARPPWLDAPAADITARLRRQAPLHTQDEEEDDLDRWIPSSSSRALLEMEDPLHGIIDLAPDHGKLLIWSLLSISRHRFHLALAPVESDYEPRCHHDLWVEFFMQQISFDLWVYLCFVHKQFSVLKRVLTPYIFSCLLALLTCSGCAYTLGVYICDH